VQRPSASSQHTKTTTIQEGHLEIPSIQKPVSHQQAFQPSSSGQAELPVIDPLPYQLHMTCSADERVSDFCELTIGESGEENNIDVLKDKIRSLN